MAVPLELSTSDDIPFQLLFVEFDICLQMFKTFLSMQ